ncbi:uncharacterized protein [Nicotiana sylvestris]|uniref:uncharacterized protein n=1 Tax=Nicotiana sylvestris TaxID=4096 RepID=UPI00388C81E0
MSLKIKEEVTKQIKSKVLRVVEYPTWLATKERRKGQAQSTVICEPIFKMLRKDAETSWTENCQKTFDKIKEYLSTPPVLVLPELGRPSLLYLFVLDGAFGCTLGQHDETGRKEQVIYYLSKKFTPYEAWYKKSGPPRIPRYCHICIMCRNCERDKSYINPIPVRIHNQPAYCAHVEEEADRKPWFNDIKEYLSKREYLEHANHTQKCTLRRLSNHFFHSGGNLYRRTPDLGLLRCIDAREASKLLEDVHTGTCGLHINGFVLAKKILKASYFWMTMETDCIQFILVAIDYFTKWVEVASYKAVTKKVVADFVKDRIVCRFGVPESIVTDNAANLNSDLMKAIMSIAFNIKPRQFTPGQLVLKKIFPHQDEAKGKFSPNWKGPYMVHRVLTGGVLILAEMDGEVWPKPINSDAVKRYYA